jgi:hypothetical protein
MMDHKLIDTNAVRNLAPPLGSFFGEMDNLPAGTFDPLMSRAKISDT